VVVVLAWLLVLAPLRVWGGWVVGVIVMAVGHMAKPAEGSPSPEGVVAAAPAGDLTDLFKELFGSGLEGSDDAAVAPPAPATVDMVGGLGL
jgi:hypothetical protein